MRHGVGTNRKTALKQLNQNSGDFRTAVADVKLTTVAGKDAKPLVESGKAYFSRDGQFRFEIATPKADKARASVSRIHVAIEQGSWLPLQQTMFHSDAVQHFTMDYAQVSRNVPVEDSMFKPKWPKGTKTISR